MARENVYYISEFIHWVTGITFLLSQCMLGILLCILIQIFLALCIIPVDAVKPRDPDPKFSTTMQLDPLENLEYNEGNL